MAKKAAAGGNKVFDVAKPGKSAPDTSSRPVIVGHRPMLQDPMMSPTAPTDDLEAAKEESLPAKNITVTTKKIVPLNEAIDEVAAEALKSTKKAIPVDAEDSEVITVTTKPKETEAGDTPKVSPAAEVSEPPAVEPEAEPVAEPEEKPDTSESADEAETATASTDDKAEVPAEAKPEPAKTPEKPEPTPPVPDTYDGDSDAADVDMAAQASKDKIAEKQLNQEDKIKNEAIDKLVAAKKYFVPIGETKRKRSSRAATVILVFLLIVALGVYLAIDAGYLDVGLDMPYDIIKT